MKRFPETRALDDAELSGHLWIQAVPTGVPLRFQLQDTGLVVFGDEARVYDVGDDLPLPYRSAAAEVRRNLDREVLGSSVDDPSSLTFQGIATVYRGVSYSWSEVPAFLGVDVYSGSREDHLPPDAASSAYRRLGIETPPVLEQEVSHEYADLEAYVDGDAPYIEEYGGEAAKVLVRDKSGGRAEAVYPVGEDEPWDAAVDVEEVVDGYVSRRYVETVVDDVVDEDKRSVEAVSEAVVNDLVRRRYSELYTGEDSDIDEDDLRSTTAEKVSYLMS